MKGWPYLVAVVAFTATIALAATPDLQVQLADLGDRMGIEVKVRNPTSRPASLIQENTRSDDYIVLLTPGGRVLVTPFDPDKPLVEADRHATWYWSQRQLLAKFADKTPHFHGEFRLYLSINGTASNELTLSLRDVPMGRNRAAPPPEGLDWSTPTSTVISFLQMLDGTHEQIGLLVRPPLSPNDKSPEADVLRELAAQARAAAWVREQINARLGDTVVRFANLANADAMLQLRGAKVTYGPHFQQATVATDVWKVTVSRDPLQESWYLPASAFIRNGRPAWSDAFADRQKHLERMSVGLFVGKVATDDDLAAEVRKLNATVGIRDILPPTTRPAR